MVLEGSIAKLSIAPVAANGKESNEVNQIDGFQVLEISLNEENRLVITKNNNGNNISGMLRDLNKLWKFNQSALDSTEEENNNKLERTELLELIETVKPSLLHIRSSHQTISYFISCVALFTLNVEIKDLLKDGEDREEKDNLGISKLVHAYHQALQMLKELGCQMNSKLLAECDFISPLLIFILERLKLRTNGETTSQLTKILALLITYHLNHPVLLNRIKTHEQHSTPSCTSTENDTQKIFGVLWQKVIGLCSAANGKYDLICTPGPVSLMNKFELFNEIGFSTEYINQLMPYSMEGYLSRLDYSVKNIYPILISLKDSNAGESQIASYLIELLSFFSNEIDTEVTKALLKTLNMEEKFLSFKSSEAAFQAHQLLLFRLASVCSLSNSSNEGQFDQGLQFMTATLDAPILHSFPQSPYACYKVLFELIDQNGKINLPDDFNFSLLLERSLISIYQNFDVIEDHGVITELGSLYSLEGIFNYSLFIIDQSLLQCVNPKKQLSSLLSEKLDLKRFPPIPRSEFLDFESLSINKSQLNLKNFQRLINSSFLLNRIILKLLQGFKQHKNVLDMIEGLEGASVNLEFRSLDLLLELYFSVLFSNLFVANEFITIAETSPSLFHEYESIGNMIKLETFENFEGLCDLYGTFSLYKLINFVNEISFADLELQEIAFKLLHHLCFHSNDGLDKVISNTEIIKRPMIEFVNAWNNGNDDYNDFCELLKLSKVQPSSRIPFENKEYLRILGYIQEITVISPAATSSRSMNLSIDSTSSSVFSSASTSISTPLTAFSHQREASQGIFNQSSTPIPQLRYSNSAAPGIASSSSNHPAQLSTMKDFKGCSTNTSFNKFSRTANSNYPTGGITGKSIPHSSFSSTQSAASVSFIGENNSDSNTNSTANTQGTPYVKGYKNKINSVQSFVPQSSSTSDSSSSNIPPRPQLQRGDNTQNINNRVNLGTSDYCVSGNTFGCGQIQPGFQAHNNGGSFNSSSAANFRGNNMSANLNNVTTNFSENVNGNYNNCNNNYNSNSINYNNAIAPFSNSSSNSIMNSRFNNFNVFNNDTATASFEDTFTASKFANSSDLGFEYNKQQSQQTMYHSGYFHDNNNNMTMNPNF